MTIQDISLRKLSGSKGGSKVTNTSDNLFSTDVVEALLGISEGPIKGLKDGAKTYLIGETALQDTSGSSNFENFELINYKGSEVGEDIYSRLGGFGASTTVSTQLATNVAVIRTGQHSLIDYLDVRFAINQLVKSTQKGTFNHTGKWTIEYKPVSETVWTPVRTPEKNPLPPQISGPSFDIFYGDEGTDKNINASPGDRPTFWASSQPISTANAAIWFNTSNNYQPKTFNGTAWSLPTGLVFANNHWSWSEASSWGADKSTKAFVGTKLPKNATYEQGDYWLRTDKNQAYFYNGSSWIIAGSSLRPGTFGENGTGGTIEVKDGEISITAKTTQVFPKEFRIPVKRINEPYMIRVVKTSPINTTELFFDITWESFQEVTAKPYKFPALAATQLVARASEQFSSIPDFSGIYQGRIIRVPSNYDPVARTYTGVWDGTWKLAYSNNPAYVANDLVQNDRYGMNAYYPITLSKWDVYDAGVWCDTRTTDGRPRFTYNGLISDPRGGRDALNYICGIFAGRFFDDGNGTGVIKVDRDGGAAVVFAPENVVDGIFTYSFTEISTRHNDITVAFTNPDLNWAEDRRRVSDQDHIDQYGRIPHNFVAVGCTSAEEAIVRARYHLITGIKETMMVNFKTNRMGLYMSPYDVILLSDPDMEFGVTGRVQAVTGPRKIKLREPIHLEPGFSHRISFQLISEATNDFVVETRNLTSATGSLTELNVTTDLPTLPADAVFTIEQTNGDAAPVAFRVMSISEIDGDPDNVEIQAMQMHRAKWLFIDGHIGSIADLDKYVLDSKKKPKPIQNLRVKATKRRVGSRYAVTIALDWDKSPTKTVSRYKILGSRDNGPVSTLADTALTQFEWDDVPAGEYLFQVVAVDVNGYESKAIVIEHRLIGDHLEVDDITALRLIDGASATVFENRSPAFRWGKNTSPTFEEYVVQICNTGGGLIREQMVDEPTYTYEYPLNLADNGGKPRRSFMIRVASKDQFGFLSDFEELTVSNPPPAAPDTRTVTLRKGVPIVKYEPSPERDFVGAVIYSSTTQGFTPSASNLKYKGPNTDVALDLEEGETNYIRLAFYDVFGDTGLNFAPEMSIVVPKNSDGDLDPPGKPTGLVVTRGIGFLIAEWVNASDTDFDSVEFFYNTTNNISTAKFGAVSNGESVIIPGLKHGQLYYIWARTKDQSGNRSDFTDPVTGTPFKIDTEAVDAEAIRAANIAANAVEVGKLAANAVTNEKIAALSIDAAKLQDQIIDTSKIAANAVAAGKIAANAVSAEQLAALAVNAEKLAENAVTVGKIVDNAINAAKIAANAVTATQLANLAVNSRNVADAAIQAAAVAANAITTAKLAANAVTADQLAALAVNATKIADSAISASKIVANAVTAAAIAANAVTTEQIMALSVNSSKLAENAVTVNKIVDNAINAAKIAANAVTASQLADLAVNEAALADAAVSSNKIVANAITATKVAAGAITAREVAANAITALQISAGAITAGKVAANAIQAGNIAAGVITAGEIAAGAITATQIAANAVTATQILANAITTVKIAANAVTATEVAAGAIQAGQIAANAVTAAKVAANAITATQIAANAVTAEQILANAITTVKIAAGAVTAAEIAAGSIVAGNIAANAITAGKINADAITAREIAANAVTAEQILASAITAVKIAANAVTATAIAANTIVAGNIAANAITGNELAANSVTATSIAANAVTATSILANAITTVKIAANAVTANEIAANAVTAASIAANTITGAKIAANTITGNEIAANTISAKQLIIADWENCIPDGMFENADFTDVWAPTGGTFNGTTGGAGFWLWGTTQSGRYSLVIDRLTVDNPTSMYATQRDYVAVEEASVLAWETELFAGNGAASAAGAYYRIYWYDAAKAALATTAYTDAISNGPIPSTWTVYKGQVTVPTGARYARVRFYHTSTSTTRFGVFDRIILRKAKGGDLIVNGSVTATKIAANSITSGQIAANAITGSEIAANAITAGKIAANTITSGQIAANTITAAEIAANAITAVKVAANAITATHINVTSIAAISATLGTFQTATSGQRTRISDAMIRVYDANNVERVRLGVW